MKGSCVGLVFFSFIFIMLLTSFTPAWFPDKL